MVERDTASDQAVDQATDLAADDTLELLSLLLL
jgi:hypothetical protein